MSLLRKSETISFGLFSLAAVISACLVLLIVLFLLKESWPILEREGLSAFLSGGAWAPREDSFDLLAMAVGTLAVTAGALLIASSCGILVAFYARFFAPPRLLPYIRRSLEILAGIPSVVFGFWGLTEIVPLINRWHPPGASLLAASLVLSLMILPTLTLMAESSLREVPRGPVEGALALGLGPWATLRTAVYPAAKPGIFSAILLSAARAMGETMAVIMVCGNIVQVPTSVFDPVRTLTANIALEMAYALNFHRAALFVSGLLLATAVAILVSFASLLRPRYDG